MVRHWRRESGSVTAIRIRRMNEGECIMKLITLECPKCNAQLEVNMMLKQATCNCCGFQFLIDDESRQVHINLDDSRRIGYEIAMGNADQRMEEGRLCARKVWELMNPVAELNRIISERNTLNLQIAELKNNTIGVKAFPLGISFLISFIGVFIGYASANADAVAIGLAVAIFTFCVWLFQRYRKAETEKQLEQKISQYNELDNRINWLNQQYDFNFIPEAYRSESAMNFLYDMLINQRAVSLQQAINLYEEEKYRRRMEEIQRQQLLLQRQQYQAMEEQNRQAAAQNRKLRQIEENTREQEDEGSGLGKAIAVGGVIMALISLAKKGE